MKKIERLVVFVVSLWLITGSVCLAKTKGLVAYWSFDGGKGNIAKDSVSGNDGTIYGATWVKGISGKALFFDGKDDYIDCGNDASLNITGSITIEAWVKFDFLLDYSSSTGKLLGIAGKGMPDSSEPNAGWWFGYDNRNNGKSFCYTCFGNSAGGSAGGENNFGGVYYTFTPDQFYHVVVTAAESTGRLYINGAQHGSAKAFSNLVLSDTTRSLRIGRLSTSGYYFNGTIDEVRIYNRVLSASEVKNCYKKYQVGIANNNKRSFKRVSSGMKLVSNQGYEISKDWIPLKNLGKDFWFIIHTPEWEKMSLLEEEPMVKESGTVIDKVLPPPRVMQLRRIAIREIEVFGPKKAKNLALGAKVTAWCEQGKFYGLKRINNGKIFGDICFSSPAEKYHQQKGWIELNFGKKTKINKVILYHDYGEKYGLYRISDFLLQYGPFYRNLIEIKNNQLSQNTLTFKPIITDRVRICISGQLYGKQLSIANLSEEAKKYSSTKKPFLFSFLRFEIGQFLGLNSNSVDYEAYAQWKKKYKDAFLGFWMPEWVNDINNFYGWSGWSKDKGGLYSGIVGKEDAKKYPRLSLLNKNKKERCKLLEDIFKWEKEVLFNDVYPMTGGACFDHYAAEWGANMIGSEFSSCNYGVTYQFREMFARSASRQYHKPWMHYQAYFYRSAYPAYVTPEGKSAVAKKTVRTPHGPDFGMPVSLGRRSLYHAYFAGANYLSFECEPIAFLQDKDNNGVCELSPHGEVLKEVFEFAKKHPDRGTAYTPVGLLLDYYHGWMPQPHEKKHIWFSLPFQKGDYMIDEFMQTIYPSRKEMGRCIGLAPTPYGDIFDVLIPNPPSGTISLSTLDNYKVLIALGDIRIDKKLAERLIEYVRKGGTLFLNNKQVNNCFPKDFLGVEIIEEPEETSRFTYQPIKLLRAKPLITDNQGRIMATLNRYGKGNIIFTTASYLLNKDNKMLSFMPTILSEITKEILPGEVKGDGIGYQFNKTEDGWLIILMNNNGVIKDRFKPEEFDFAKTAKVKVIFKKKPKKIVELRTGKKINYKSQKGLYTVTTKIVPGDIQVLEATF